MSRKDGLLARSQWLQERSDDALRRHLMAWGRGRSDLQEAANYAVLADSYRLRSMAGSDGEG